MNKIYGFDGEVGHGYKVRIKNMNKIHGFDGGVRAWLQCADYHIVFHVGSLIQPRNQIPGV